MPRILHYRRHRFDALMTLLTGRGGAAGAAIARCLVAGSVLLLRRNDPNQASAR
ncbi:hypothetical protein [Pseudooceanicola lipolyticus]|uniref:hypothetical protein n=1 Tax=Pseudooceanicola lipolyticus TaxID=2029104 RepID=UPI00155F10F9|nr:hypothetical protein [Pseudooceanicola lipolyticus]